MHRSLTRCLAAVPVAWLALGLMAAPVAADDAVQMTARALLDGHARVGSWVAIAVDLANDGPPIVGELALAAGTSGKTRYAVPVDLPTQSDKTYVIHAQAPSFGGRLTVSLVTTTGIAAERTVDVTVHDAGQLVIGVVAERPQGLAGVFRLLPGPTGTAAAIVALEPADLPDRVEAWSAIDRLVWQDVDTDTLSSGQLAALAGWVAGGGRLVIVGGTAGPDALSALPDELLPYRPTSTVDVAPGSLVSLLGVQPAAATDVPGLAGTLAHGRAMARVGDQVVAAEGAYGAGSVTIVGVDASTGWLATADGTEALWRRLLPPRSASGAAITDDSQLLNAVSQLPALALPPIGGLLAILAGYIVLVGPVNYLVLRRIDRREWAWVSIPLLIVGFTVGAYGIGAALRGSDVIVHEVSIVRGAADAGRGTSLVYAGVFSPTRGTYQLSVPGGALLSAPINGDFLGGDTGSTLDIVQGEPSRIRDLAVGFGSLRTIRAETPVEVPTLDVDLRLEGERVVGSLRNTSDMGIDKPSLVVGANVQTWPRLGAGETVEVDLALAAQPFGASMSDKVVGPQFFEGGQSSDEAARISVRRSLIDSLTFDPSFGFSGNIPGDGPVLLGWTDDPVVSVDLADQRPRTAATTLYQFALPLRATGAVVYRNDMVRSTVVSLDAPMFNKDPTSLSMGQGSMTLAYRPMGLDGTLAATRLVLALNQAGIVGNAGAAAEIEPTGPAGDLTECVDQACPDVPGDFLPEVEILDRTTGTWMALPHFQPGASYEPKDPDRYVDPDGGTVWIRFQNQRIDGIGFSFSVSIEGNAS